MIPENSHVFFLHPCFCWKKTIHNDRCFRVFVHPTDQSQELPSVDLSELEVRAKQLEEASYTAGGLVGWLVGWSDGVPGSQDLKNAVVI